MIRLLVFTTLYPNAAQPHHGIFVEQRLRHLVASGEVQARVLAPVPWFPSAHPRFGRYAAYARVPRFERRHDIDILHPRYPVLPKFGMSAAPVLLAGAMWAWARRLCREQDFDAIDAHYFYPDGVAAVWLAKRLHKPVVVTGRGSDINVIARYRQPGRAIRWAARNADQTVVVSDALKQRLLASGVAESQVAVVPNGVDLSVFCPGSPGALARDFGVQGPALLSVGHLVEGKGHHIVIDALTRLSGFSLVIVGSGPDEAALRAQVVRWGLERRVKLAGAVAHARLAEYYRDAYAVILASRGEGMPNVVLESLACGTPVVASAVGGIPEVLTTPEAGRLVAKRTAEAFAEAVTALVASYPDRAATRRYAELFDWAATTRAQLQIFKQIMGAQTARRNDG